MTDAVPAHGVVPTTHRVLLDVDTGADDALAILFALAHPQIELIGITCVAGNTSLDNVMANTLKVLDAAGAPPIPVAAGARRPLLEPLRTSTFHGEDGLGDLSLPTSDRAIEPQHAIEFARDVLLAASEPITLVALAPQTNLALLLRAYPQVVPHIERILFMGGSASGGNATPVAEFNIWNDPEAAAIVLDSGVPTSMYGLDVFDQVLIEPSDVTALLDSHSAAARLAGALLRHGMDDANPSGGGFIGDAGALCALVDPGALLVERHPVRIDLAGLGRGQTIVDRRTHVGEDAIYGDPDAASAVAVDVALDVDAERSARLFLETIARLP